MTRWPLQSEMTLIALPNAPFLIRQHFAEVLSKWGVADNEQLENALLVITELVSNAVRHTSGRKKAAKGQFAQAPLSVAYTQLAGAGYVRVRLSWDYTRLLLEVWDKSTEPPATKNADAQAEGGRGLMIVEALSRQWGWYPARGGGKVVWAEVVRP